MAYFTSRAVAQMDHHDKFAIIAAAGRESIYEAIGSQSFPIKSHDDTLTLKLGADRSAGLPDSEVPEVRHEGRKPE